jgi:hypothetical protein
MTNKIGIYNHSTGEQNIREMTDKEIAEREADVISFAAQKTAEDAEAEAKAAQRAALLNRLGITEDEAKLLLA